MALIVLPEGQQRSGKQGGIVFSRNTFGAYTRERAVPTNPNTANQIEVRASMSDLVHRFWQTLTDGQRITWLAYSTAVKYYNRLGKQITLKPVNMYVACNAPRVQAGLDPVDVGPALLQKPNNAAAVVLSVTTATQLISVAFDNTDDWANEDGGALLVYQGQPVPVWKSYLKCSMLYAGCILGNETTPPTSPATKAAKFTFQAEQRIPILYRVVRADGRISDSFLGSAVSAT